MRVMNFFFKENFCLSLRSRNLSSRYDINSENKNLQSQMIIAGMCKKINGRCSEEGVSDVFSSYFRVSKKFSRVP
jgi:hypothetical protein